MNDKVIPYGGAHPAAVQKGVPLAEQIAEAKARLAELEAEALVPAPAPVAAPVAVAPAAPVAPAPAVVVAAVPTQASVAPAPVAPVAPAPATVAAPAPTPTVSVSVVPPSPVVAPGVSSPPTPVAAPTTPAPSAPIAPALVTAVVSDLKALPPEVSHALAVVCDFVKGSLGKIALAFAIGFVATFLFINSARPASADEGAACKLSWVAAKAKIDATGFHYGQLSAIQQATVVAAAQAAAEPPTNVTAVYAVEVPDAANPGYLLVFVSGDCVIGTAAVSDKAFTDLVGRQA